MIAYLLIGAMSGLYLFAFALGAVAAASDASVELMQDRPEPRLDHDCDVYSGCSTVGDEAERLLGLWTADRELKAAAKRMGATR